MAIDRRQLLNDAETSLRLALDGRQSQMWTGIPGIIQSVDLDAMTCEVQPTIQGQIELQSGEYQNVNLPLLVDVPIVFPSAGGFTLTFPLKADDEVLVVFASRCIDSWWQNGGIGVPMEARMHDLSDGFAIPGPKSQPNVIASIKDDSTQLRSDDGAVYLQVGASKIKIANSAKDIKGVLDGMIDLLSTLTMNLTSFSTTAATSITDPILAGAAITLLASLTALSPQLTAYKTSDIGALFE